MIECIHRGVPKQVSAHAVSLRAYFIAREFAGKIVKISLRAVDAIKRSWQSFVHFVTEAYDAFGGQEVFKIDQTGFCEIAAKFSHQIPVLRRLLLIDRKSIEIDEIEIHDDGRFAKSVPG